MNVLTGLTGTLLVVVSKLAIYAGQLLIKHGFALRKVGEGMEAIP